MVEAIAGAYPCGCVRYRDASAPLAVTHCYCSICRRASGAAFVTWVAFAADSFAIAEGSTTVFRATDKAERTFCATCGTPLTFRHIESPRQIDVSPGSLDEPDAVWPKDRVWASSALAWLAIDDGSPRHPGEREPDVG